jgi:pyruvate formate lyase activating enzyme
MNWDTCGNCFKCVDVCPSGARKAMGSSVSAKEVVEEVAKDQAFYRRSCGGVTLSGGEPLMQPEFSSEILRLCKERNIGTAIETSGYSSKKDFMKVLKYVDFVIYDIKHMNSDIHKDWVGVNNKIILENLKIIPRNTAVMIRIPIIPGFNDSDENITETALFVKQIGNVQKL